MPRKAAEDNSPEETPETENTTETESTEQVDILALKEELERLRKELAEKDKTDHTEAPKTGKFIIHFVARGFTLLGKVYQKGQELEFDTESQAYKDTCGVNGFSVLELRRNPAEQKRRFGKVYFQEGPWTGKSFAELKYEALRKMASQNDNDAALTYRELTEIEAFDKKRRSTPEPLAPIIGGVSPVGRKTGY